MMCLMCHYQEEVNSIKQYENHFLLVFIITKITQMRKKIDRRVINV